ncbi:MAG: M1 family metallopeptidase [Lewinellaceae bacterium]|nr:M1 family metallopeptidase [Lewinellaceae bacterium]
MKNILLVFCLLFSASVTFSQTIPYFQQEAHYTINVTLDDVNHLLTGDVAISYVNHAPEALDSIWFHLWPNAFENEKTAFAQQKLRAGSTKFYFAKDTDLGYFSGLDFRVDGEKAEWYQDPKNPDMAVLKLSQPLRNKRKVVISTPFTLKIPASFSRLGHVGQSYQITQWYPKPAVYDNRGWHPMPYLDQGEYYSEFGSFDVSITLPENYVVGATGTLQTGSEVAFLTKKAQQGAAMAARGFPKGEDFPPSSEKLKTIRYTADYIHDFAWFADKRFNVLKGEVKFPTGRTVDTWTMFSNEQADLWANSIEYVNRAVQFYSDKVGEYPYPQCTAVHSALSAGGGMEYPMITVIGNSNSASDLDDVLTHEVGHNWFYGILAFNERDHPWMDEGINSYYEYRYMQENYGNEQQDLLPRFLAKTTNKGIYETAYLYQARRNLDQAPETTSNDLTPINYGVCVYVKTGFSFMHLEHYLGTQRFDAIMQSFYKNWKFAHPYPDDLRAHFKRESGEDLSWFFDGYIDSTKKLDYALTGIAPSGGGYAVTVENKGEIAAPFPISGMKNGEVATTQWFKGFEGEQTITFPEGDYDWLVLDQGHLTLDVQRRNNNIRTSGILKRLEPFAFPFLRAIENSSKTGPSWVPIAGWNKYDGAMLGLAVYKGGVPAQHLEFVFAPMYGFGSKDLTGFSSVKFNIYPKKAKVRKVSFGITAKAFNFRSVDSLRTETGYVSTDLYYRRLMPFVKIDLARSLTSKFYQTIQFRSILLQERAPVFTQDSSGVLYNGNQRDERIFNELSYEIGDRRALNPYSLRLVFEQSRYDDIFNPAEKLGYLRASLEGNFEFTYDYKRSVDLRLFAGGFLQNDGKSRGAIFPGAYNLTGQGFNDYRYDELYFGRSETDGFFAQQIMPREGGMKIALGSPYSEGRSNNFLLAANLSADLPQDLPGKLPLKPYFDIGYYDDNRSISSDLEFADQLWWQGGIELRLAKGIASVFFPVVNSKNVKDLYNGSGRSKFWERITFTLDLNKLNPFDLIENISF